MTWEHVIQSLTGILVSGVTAYAVTFMLNFGRKKWLYISLVLVIGLAIKLVVDCVFSLHWLNSILEIALFAGLALMADEKVMRKIFAAFLALICNVVGDGISTLIILSMGSNLVNAFFDSSAHPWQYTVCIIVMNLINGILLYLLVTIWNKMIKKAETRHILWFVLFPVSQVLIIWLAMVPIVQSNDVERGMAILTVVCLICVAADIAMFFAIRQLIRDSSLRQKAEFMENQLGQQQSYYDHIVRDAEASARIRHDIRNQLQTAYSLLDKGEVELARGQLNGISDRVAAVESPCENKIVGALLSEKDDVCREKGIQFEKSLDVPNSLPFNGVELCSIFSNLLDNAIAACSATADPDANIELRAGVRGGFFIVKCCNTSPTNVKKAVRSSAVSEHGWGITILEEIAAKHNGRVETMQENSIFTATVWLSC